LTVCVARGLSVVVARWLAGEWRRVWLV
jgi:hypothetical protein